MITLLNPIAVHRPSGNYSHTATVAAGAPLLFVSGQVGVRPDGSIPASFAEQAELVFLNLRSCLAAHGLDETSVVKLTAYLVLGQDVQAMRKSRAQCFGVHEPTATTVLVAGLVSPDLLLEVEAVAVANPS